MSTAKIAKIQTMTSIRQLLTASTTAAQIRATKAEMRIIHLAWMRSVIQLRLTFDKVLPAEETALDDRGVQIEPKLDLESYTQLSSTSL